MRWLAALLTLALPVAAAAQTLPPITTTPLMPPSPLPSISALPSPDRAPAVPQEPAKAAPRPLQYTWVPQGNAQLQVLDKVNGLNASLTVKVGEATSFGSLNIHVQACNTHPADQPQDAAAYLTITDSRTDAPGFRGWMLANNPSLSMLQHPIYDVRIIGCRT